MTKVNSRWLRSPIPTGTTFRSPRPRPICEQNLAFAVAVDCDRPEHGHEDGRPYERAHDVIPGCVHEAQTRQTMRVEDEPAHSVHHERHRLIAPDGAQNARHRYDGHERARDERE